MNELLKRMLDGYESLVVSQESRYAWAIVTPKSKQSTRFGSGHAFTPPRKKWYMEHLAADLQCGVIGPAFGGPVRVTVLFSFPWRKKDDSSVFVWALMDKQPDIDNLIKPLADSIREIACANDGQIASVRATKIRFSFPCVALKVDKIVENYEFKIT